MARTATVKAGTKGLVLPDGNSYDEGDEVTLTDAQWDALTDGAEDLLEDVEEVADVTEADIPDEIARDDEVAAAIAAIPAGGGGGGFLGKTMYVPGTPGIILNGGNSGSRTAIDWTNIRCAFTAPASGSVLVELEATVSDGSYYFSLTEGPQFAQTTIGPEVYVPGSGGAGYRRARVGIVLTGLTADEEYTVFWAYRVATTPNLTVLGGTPYGQVIMTVQEW